MAIYRAIVLGFYDGATDGIMQFDTNGTVYHFELDPKDGDSGLLFPERPFVLRPLPSDVLDRLIALFAPHEAPRWPVWFLRWQELDVGTRNVLDPKIEAILAEAGPVTFRLTTSDPWTFSAFSIRRVHEPVSA